MNLYKICINYLFLFVIIIISSTGSVFSSDNKANITDYLDQNEKTGMFSEMIRSGKLHKTLTTTGPFTVFAFTDSVYSRLPISVRNNIESDEFHNWRLRMISNHLFHDLIELPYSEHSINISSITGNTIHLVKRKDEYFINNARIIGKPVSVKNGVIMFVDAIIIP